MAEDSLGWAGTPPTPELMAAAAAGRALADKVAEEAAADHARLVERRDTLRLGMRISVIVLCLLLLPIYLGVNEWMETRPEPEWSHGTAESVRIGEDHLAVRLKTIEDRVVLEMLHIDAAGEVVETADLKQLDRGGQLTIDAAHGMPFIGLEQDGRVRLWMLEAWNDPEWRHLVEIHDLGDADSARYSSEQRFMRIGEELAVITSQTSSAIDPDTGTAVWHDRIEVHSLTGEGDWLVRVDTDAGHAFVGGTWNGTPSVGLVIGNVHGGFRFETCALLPSEQASCEVWSDTVMLPFDNVHLDALTEDGLRYRLAQSGVPQCYSWDGLTVELTDPGTDAHALCQQRAVGGALMIASPSGATNITVQHDGILTRDQLVAVHWEGEGISWMVWNLVIPEAPHHAMHRFDAAGNVAPL